MGGWHFAASGSFCLGVLFVTIVIITFKPALKNMQKLRERLGSDDNREATWPVRS